MMFLRTALLVLRKDFAIEVKSREILSTTLFFAVVVRAGVRVRVRQGRAGGSRTPRPASCGSRFAFAGTLALGRTFERERYGETLRALLLAPAPRPALYVGKLLGIVLLLGLAEAAAGAAASRCCSGAAVSRGRCCWLALLATGTVGFARGRHAVRRDADAGADARRAAADPVVSDHDSGDHCWRARHVGAARVAADEPTATMWLGDAGRVFDVVFVTLALWTFEPLMTE